MEERLANLCMAVSVNDLPEDIVVHSMRKCGCHHEASHRHATALGDIDELFPVTMFVASHLASIFIE